MTEADDLRPPSSLIAGKYRVTRLLGRGGMGAVWEGVHESLGTRVAIKFIDAEHAGSKEIGERFVNEARAAARLRSKHVVQVYDQGVGDDGRPYIVMEFLSGEPLDQRLERNGRIAPLEAARITLHVSRALAKAHEAGIVHRDLKPENVFLVRDDEDDADIAKVVDFGIAKITDPGSPSSSSTRTGAVLGTPQYMSPEQARGLRTVDRRTDLWALGVIVYRAVVGAMPFKGEALGDLLVNICTSDPPVPSSIASDVPAGFDEWVRRALAREPDDRFQSAGELSDSFAALCGLDAKLSAASSQHDPPSSSQVARTPAVTASPFATTPMPSVPSRRLPWVGLAALFVVVLAIAVFGARAVLHSSPEVAIHAAAAEPQPSVSVSVPASAPPAPEVVPASAPPPPVVSAAPPEHRPIPEGTPRASHARPERPPEAEPSKPAPTPAPHPARPADLLGY